MTTEKLLENLKTVRRTENLYERNILLDNLIEKVTFDLCEECGKACGQNGLSKTAKDILKLANAGNTEALKYAYTAPDGTQWICDGYRLLHLTNPLPLPELPKSVFPLRYEKVIRPQNNPVQLELPNPAKLKAYIKIKKAKKQKHIDYDFGETLPVCNAEFLLSMLEAFPEATVTVEASTVPTNTAQIHFASGDDFGLLLPVMPRTTRSKTILP